MLRVIDPDVQQAMAASFLGSLPAELVDALVTDGQRVDYPPASVFFRESSPPRADLILSGLVRVYINSPAGRQLTVRYLRRSDVFGMAFVYGGPPNVVSLQALEPSSVFSVSLQTLRAAAQTDARVAWLMVGELTRQLLSMVQQTQAQAFGSVKRRVATHLLDLASDRQRPGSRLIAEVTQQELADAVGSVREVIARTLRDLRLSGLVATSTDRIVLLDPVRLHEESTRLD